MNQNKYVMYGPWEDLFRSRIVNEAGMYVKGLCILLINMMIT